MELDHLGTLTKRLQDLKSKMTTEEYTESWAKIKAKKLGGPTVDEYMKLLTESMVGSDEIEKEDSLLEIINNIAVEKWDEIIFWEWHPTKQHYKQSVYCTKIDKMEVSVESGYGTEPPIIEIDGIRIFGSSDDIIYQIWKKVDKYIWSTKPPLPETDMGTW